MMDITCHILNAQKLVSGGHLKKCVIGNSLGDNVMAVNTFSMESKVVNTV